MRILTSSSIANIHSSLQFADPFNNRNTNLFVNYFGKLNVSMMMTKKQQHILNNVNAKAIRRHIYMKLKLITSP